MAQLLQAFNAQTVSPDQGSAKLPVGKHRVIIASSEIKATAANDGGYLELTLQIIDGPAQGGGGAFRLNLYSSSAKAAEIAQRQMSALCHAVGVFQVNDSSQLHNLPFMVQVELQPGEEAAAKGYTQVSHIYDVNGNEPGKQAAAPQAQPPQGFAPPQQAPQGFAPQQPPQAPQGFQPPQQPQQPPQPAWGAPSQPAQPAGPSGAPATGWQPPQQPQQAPQAPAAGQVPWGAPR